MPGFGHNKRSTNRPEDQGEKDGKGWTQPSFMAILVTSM